MSFALQYKPHAMIDDLKPGECTIHRAGNATGAKWWNLWFCAVQDTDGQQGFFCVPVAPGGTYAEQGPGGRTWGFKDTGGGIWQVSPSINVTVTKEIHPGQRAEKSLFHQTPAVVYVPPGEPWANG